MDRCWEDSKFLIIARQNDQNHLIRQLLKNTSLRLVRRIEGSLRNHQARHYSDLAATRDAIAPFSRAEDTSGVERSGSKVGLIIVRKMKTIVGSAESRNTMRTRRSRWMCLCTHHRAACAWECVRMRVCLCLRTLLLGACEFARNGDGGRNRGRRKERETSMLEPCDRHGSKEWSWGLRLSEHTADEREKERNEKERNKEAKRGEVQIRPDERSREWRFTEIQRQECRPSRRRRDKMMTRGTKQENDKSRKWEKNGACCEREIEDCGGRFECCKIERDIRGWTGEQLEKGEKKSG